MRFDAERSSTRIHQVAVVLAAFLLGPSLGYAATVVGRTAGSFAVSSSGAATYTIPIQVPPGIAGLQPGLALSYSSSSGNGLLGVGWQLTGFSSVSRCGKTQAQDSVAGGPQLDSNDRFCLDGNRLRTTGGSTYGANGATYQTEIANFSNVISHGTAGSGPAWFEVQGKDGLTYEFGNTADSAILASGSSSVRVWALNKVKDRNGNAMTYVYANDTANGSYRPQSILYTFTMASPSTTSYKVVFTYQSRSTADGLWTYTVGGKNDELNYLYQVEADYWNGSAWSAVHTYTLSYDNSPTTSRTRLTSVRECAGADCFAPTTVSYQAGQQGWSSEVSTSIDLSLKFMLPIDVNGDGIDDILYPDSGSARWRYLLGTTSGYQGSYDTGVASASYASAVPIDYNSDGKMDLLVPNGSGFWKVLFFQSAGGTFSSTTTTTPSVTAGDGSVMVGDMNGDGREDLIYAVVTGTINDFDQPDHIYYRLNTGTGFSSTQNTLLTTQDVNITGVGTKLASAAPFGGTMQRFRGRVRAPDYNGDGRIDFSVAMRRCLRNDDASCNYAAYRTQLWSLSDGTFGNLGGGGTASVINGDFNSDGCSDYFGGSGVVFGSCYRTGGSVNGGSAAYTNMNGIVMVADWDADGRDDVLQLSLTTGTWGYNRSSGNAMGAWVNLSIPFTYVGGASGGDVYLVADVNGDGLDDLLFAQGGVLKTRLHNGVKPDLATVFTDAYGNSISPSYTALTQNNYTKYADAVFPEQDYQGPLTVVSGVTASDGIGGTYTQSFWYYGARVHLQGRGFEGFEKQRTLDSRNSLYAYEQFNRTFPYTGTLAQSALYQADNATPISKVVNTPATPITLDATANNQRYFPYTSSSISEQYEFGNTKNGQLITAAAIAYAFDNYGNATSVTTTVTDKDTGSPYYNQSWTTSASATLSPDAGSNWCLGLPTQTTVTKSAPSVVSITRTASFAPDYAKCRMTQKITEPASGTYAVTEAYGYDGFGNVNSVTVTGIGMTARSNGIYWGTNGQFPLTATNPLNQSTTSVYDPVLGVLTSRSDPNGIAIGFQYDSFGRKTRESRPDGTATTWAYSDCTSDSSCVNANNRMKVLQTVLNQDASVQTDGASYLDKFERPLITQQRMLGTTYSRSETQYDALGRPYRQAVPCWVGSCSTQYWVTSNFDALNRVTLIQRPFSATDSADTLVEYLGRTTIVTDPLNKKTTKIATVAGTLGRSQDSSGYYQSFAYDAFGSLTAVADSAANSLFSATYDYGIGAFQRTITDMDLGARSYSYNALGELMTGSDGHNPPHSMTYDALSRPLTRTESEGVTTWTWDGAGAGYLIGKLSSVTSPGYTESYTYDNKGRVAVRRIVTDQTYDFGYAYDNTTGALDTLTYPTSTSGYRLRLKYGYDRGILKQIKDDNSTTVFWEANSINARGQITQESLGTGVTVTNRAYDAATGYVSSIQSGVGSGSALQNESYLFDKVGNLIQRQNGNLGLTENFYYDNLHRLDRSTLGAATNLSLTYDAMGNITSRSDIASGALWTYDTVKKHAVRQAGDSSHTYTYDANGNAITRNGYNLTWTSYNYPSVISGPNKSMTFSYGADRQRFKQVYTNGSTTETTMYVGGLLEKVTIGGMVDWRHYISAGGQTVAVMSRQSTGTTATRYLLADHQGSVSQIIDASGASYVSESFTAFGARRDATTWAGSCNCTDLGKMKSVTRRAYTGHEAIGGVSLGLNHMNGRVQDAITGRFLSPDPYVTDPGNTQNYNRYSYVLNNPLTMIDPSGFDIETVVVSGSSGGGGGFVHVGQGSVGGAYSVALQNGPNPRLDASVGIEPRTTPAGEAGDTEVTTTASRIPPPSTVGGAKGLDTLAAPWGGWSGLTTSVRGIWQDQWPGDGSLEANLAGLPMVPVVGAEATTTRLARVFHLATSVCRSGFGTVCHQHCNWLLTLASWMGLSTEEIKFCWRQTRRVLASVNTLPGKSSI